MKTVWRNLTQQQLDDAYDQAAYAPNRAQIIARYQHNSERTIGRLGEPDVYPNYADAKNGWDLSEENAGHEFIELEFPFPVYINAFELYEVRE